MNTRGIPHLVIFMAMIGLVCGSPALKAQDTPVSSDQKLTGSVVKVEDIISTCDAVFLGEITDIGVPSDPADDGWTVTSGIGVSVSENLRGSVESQIKVTLRTLSSSSTQESTPKFEGSYIFFVNKTADASEDPYMVVKLLPATDTNIAMVKQLIEKPSP